MIDLAKRYGGFTSLDEVYLKNRLKGLSHKDQLDLITPPPSVVNAYFAEIYQKQSPEAACHYFFDMTKNLALFQEDPSFTQEAKPFIRLNLSGTAFGFCYANVQEEAIVFPETTELIGPSRAFEVAQIFPLYQVAIAGDRMHLSKSSYTDADWHVRSQETYLITQIEENEEGYLLHGPSQDEVIEASEAYRKEGMIAYYAWKHNEAIVYLKK